MPRVGGESGKLGDQYESIWTVDRLIDVCIGKATQICVEEPGAEADGIEFRLMENGVNSFHSVKRQRSSGEWSLAELTRPSPTGRSILGDFFKILRDDSHASCTFVSATGANDLREACEVAQKCNGIADFNGLMTSKAKLRRDLEKFLVENSKLAEWDEVQGFLKRITVKLKDPSTLRLDTEERLNAYFIRLDSRPIIASEVRLSLGEYVLDKLGVPLSQDGILEFLKTRDIVRRDAISQPDVRDQLKRNVEHYCRVVNGDLVNSNPILRDEADDAVQKLTDPTISEGVLVVGNAGFGKSCVLVQVIKQFPVDIPVMVVRLDELDVMHTTTELGESQGLSMSPIASLAGVAGNHQSVFVIDQLDAVSELSGRKSELWNIFERLRTESLRFPKMKFLVACRAFDLEHDHRLRRLTSKDSGFTLITLNPLSISTVETALTAAGIDPGTVSGKERELLQVPLHLQLFLICHQNLQKPIESLQELFNKFWEVKQAKVRSRCNGDSNWSEVINSLTDNMSSRASLTTVDDVVAQWKITVDAMTSEHVLVRKGRQVRFFHESFVDYAFARRFVARGEPLVNFLRTTDQGLFYRSLVRQVLTHLREDNNHLYLQTLPALMKNKQIRFHLKILVLNWLSGLRDPTEAEWRIVEDLSNHPEFENRAFWVIRNTVGWFDLLDDLGILDGWISSHSELFRNLALWLMNASTIRQLRSAAIAKLLRGMSK